MPVAVRARVKTRCNHVRTGCVTCKRRRVKCDEAKPFCTRCHQGGFLCQGYDIPKTWLFEGRGASRSQTHTSLHNSSSSDTISSTQKTSNLPLTYQFSPLTWLQYGNADPFASYAIPITPFENQYIKFYYEDVIPSLYVLNLRKWLTFMAYDDWKHCLNTLHDETAAYGLLARNVAINLVITQGPNPSPSTLLLHYLAKAQASLRKKLTFMTENATPQSIYPVMWTTFFLGFAELLVRAPSSIVHVTALNRLVIRYIDKMGPNLDRGALHYLLYIDIQRSCVTFSRPVFDFYDCWARLYRDEWVAGQQKVHLPPNAFSTDIHPDVKDATIRAMILIKREGQQIYGDLMGNCFNVEDSGLVSRYIHSRNLFFQGRVINVAIDALLEADELDCDPESSQTQKKEVNTRAYIALAVLHWGRFASQAPVAGKLLFDDAPVVIPRLRDALMKTKLPPSSPSSSPPTLIEKDGANCDLQPYNEARLWALFVGTQSEQHRQDFLSLPKLCGDWFADELRTQAKSMGVQSWEAAVAIFQRFLYSDKLRPHISLWW